MEGDLRVGNAICSCHACCYSLQCTVTHREASSLLPWPRLVAAERTVTVTIDVGAYSHRHQAGHDAELEVLRPACRLAHPPAGTNAPFRPACIAMQIRTVTIRLACAPWGIDRYRYQQLLERRRHPAVGASGCVLRPWSCSWLLTAQCPAAVARRAGTRTGRTQRPYVRLPAAQCSVVTIVRMLCTNVFWHPPDRFCRRRGETRQRHEHIGRTGLSWRVGRATCAPTDNQWPTSTCRFLVLNQLANYKAGHSEVNITSIMYLGFVNMLT